MSAELKVEPMVAIMVVLKVDKKVEQKAGLMDKKMAWLAAVLKELMLAAGKVDM
jgi:hypothetical protein